MDNSCKLTLQRRAIVIAHYMEILEAMDAKMTGQLLYAPMEWGNG